MATSDGAVKQLGVDRSIVRASKVGLAETACSSNHQPYCYRDVVHRVYRSICALLQGAAITAGCKRGWIARQQDAAFTLIMALVNIGGVAER